MSDSFENDRAIGKLGFVGEVEIDPESIAQLKQSVLAEMENDLKARLEIQRLLKTGETLDHSLGSLYAFLADRKTCSACEGRLSSCPKRKTGFVLSPYYDEQRDEIRTMYASCHYQRELERSLSHILCSSIPEAEIYQRFVSLHDEVKRHKDKKDLLQAYARILKISSAYRRDGINKGLLFNSPSKNEYPLDLLAFACYLFAMQGYSCCFVHLGKQTFLASRDYVLRRNALLDMQNYCRADCLFVIDIDQLPLSSEETCSAFERLLDSRKDKGKITFATTGQANPVASWRRFLWGRDGMAGRLDTLQDLFDPIVVRDFE